MAIDRASEIHPAFERAFNAGDLDGLMALTDDSTIFVPQPGVQLTGADAAAAQQQFMSIGLPISLTLRYVIEAGDLALVIADWTIKGTGADGKEVDLSGSTADVLRRGDDGWKFAIDNPFGTA